MLQTLEKRGRDVEKNKSVSNWQPAAHKHLITCGSCNMEYFTTDSKRCLHCPALARTALAVLSQAFHDSYISYPEHCDLHILWLFSVFCHCVLGKGLQTHVYPIITTIDILYFTEDMRNIQDGESPFPSADKWKVSVLTGNAGTRANVTLWIYGDKGVAGPIALGKDNREQLFLPRMEDAFQVANIILRHISYPHKIILSSVREKNFLLYLLLQINLFNVFGFIIKSAECM